LVSPDHVKAEGGLDDRADLPHVEREGSVGERFHHHVARETTEIAVLDRTARLVRVGGDDLVEVLPFLDEVQRLGGAQTRFFFGAFDLRGSALRTRA
jgi:hypothetical protein